MTTATRASEAIAFQTGLSAEDIRARVRYLRLAGLIKGGATGKSAPDLDEVEALLLLLGGLSQGPQVKTSEFVKSIFSLRHQRTDRVDVHDVGPNKTAIVTDHAISFSPPDFDELKFLHENNFGQVLLWAVSRCHTEQGRAQVQSLISGFSVWADGRQALIERANNGKRHWFGQPNSPDLRAPAIAPMRVSLMATAPAGILAVLSDLTQEQAAQRTLSLGKEEAPRPEANGAFEPSATQQAGKPVDHSAQEAESDISTDSASRERIVSPRVAQSGPNTRGNPNVVPIRSAAGA
jgi:hypothetical protein